MKPRRPAVKDSIRRGPSKEKSEQIAAKAARKAAAKKVKMEAEDVNQAAFRVMRESTEDR
jgi:hypothetical protein